MLLLLGAAIGQDRRAPMRARHARARTCEQRA